MIAARRNRRRTRTPRALALAGSLLLGAAAGCGPRIQVTVMDEAREPLTALRVVGQADSTRVPDVAPGASARVRVAVRGEDAIVLRGRVGHRPLSPMMAAYVENGWHLRLVVDSTGYVRVIGPRLEPY